MVTVADAEYLYFGFWLHKPDNQDNSHPFAAWAGGADLYVVNDPACADFPVTTSALIPAKIGRARYEGPAAGKYVTRNLAEATSKIGIFTATATLTADFEAPSPMEVADAAGRPDADDDRDRSDTGWREGGHGERHHQRFHGRR